MPGRRPPGGASLAAMLYCRPMCATVDHPGIPDLTGISLVLDTNVLAEIVSAGDLIRETERETKRNGSREDWRRSPQIKLRQLRARYSNLLAYQARKNGLATVAMQNEVTDTLTRHVAPRDGGLSEQFTTVIVHVLMDGPLGGALLKVVRDDDRPSPAGDRADAWLVAIAKAGNLPLITNEGLTVGGINDHNAKGKPNIRACARAEGVPVFAPVEYLRTHGVDCEKEADQLVEQIRECLVDAVNRGALPEETGKQTYETYRYILLDEVDDSLANIPAPRLPWE